MSRGPIHAQHPKHDPFPISQHAATSLHPRRYAPSFCPARCPPLSIGPATRTACFCVHPEVNLALRSPRLVVALPSVTLSPTRAQSGSIPASTFPPTPASLSSGVSADSTRLSSVASDPTATPSTSSSDSFSSLVSSKSSGASTTSGHALNQSTTATGGDLTSQFTTTTDPPLPSASSTSSFDFTTGSLSTSVLLPPLPPLSSIIMSTSTTSSTSRLPSSTPFIPFPFTSPNTTSIPISTSISNTSTTTTTTDPPGSSSSSSSLTSIMSSTPTITTSTTLDPTPTLSSIISFPTTDPNPSATIAGAASDTTTPNSHQHTSTITATRVYTFTLPGGQTTVVSTVEESRVLSTSDPVAGSRFSHNTGAIIGVAVSATVGVILSVLVVFLSCTRYRSRDEQRYRRHPHHHHQHYGKGAGGGLAGKTRGWKNALGATFGRGNLPPIPSGPIPTLAGTRRGGGARVRMDSSANILGGRAPDGGYEEEEDKVWRPPLVGDDGEEDEDEGVGGLGDVVRGASPTGRGYGCCDGAVGVGVGGTVLPTPPESGEDGRVRSSLHGRSPSRGHTSSGHGHGHGLGLGLEHAEVHGQGQGHAPPGGCSGVCVENALLGLGSVVLPPPTVVADSGAGIPAQALYPYPVYGYLPAVAGGYPGSGPAYVPPGAGAGVAAEVAPVPGFGTYAGMMGGREREVAHTTSGEVVSSDSGHQQGLGGAKRGRGGGAGGEAVKGAGGLATPRTSEGEDLGRSSDGTICEVAGGAMLDAAGLERGSGSGSSRASRASRGTTTARVDSTSTSSKSRSRRSLKEVLKRFRRSSKEISPSSAPGGGVSVLAGPVLGAIGAGGATTTTYGGAEMRPGYDYGAIVRPHQRQMVLERAFGHPHHHHHQPHMDDAGNSGLGLVPPPPAILVNHAQVAHFPLLDAYPPLELAHAPAPAPSPAGPPTILTNGPAYKLEHVDTRPCPPDPYGLGVDEIDNEEESLDPRGSVVRDKLLDPFFLSPSAGGSSPNIEGASLRDYVDYSRRIGGTVKNRVMSTTTFDTVDHDQDGASVSVGTLMDDEHRNDSPR